MSCIVTFSATTNNNFDTIPHKEGIKVERMFDLNALMAWFGSIRNGEYADMFQQGTHMYNVCLKNPSVGYEVTSWFLVK